MSKPEPYKVFNKIISEFNNNTPEIIGNGWKKEAREYVYKISPSYLRTFKDFVKLLGDNNSVV